MASKHNHDSRPPHRPAASWLVPALLLALAVGAAVALLGPVYSLALGAPPFPQARDLVAIGSGGVFDLVNGTIVNRDQLGKLFTGVAAYWGEKPSWLPDGSAATSLVATQEFFSTLGVKLFAGSGFGSGPEGAPEAVLGYTLWRRQMAAGATPSAPESLVLNGRRYSVVGIAQPGFDFPDGAQVWTRAEPGQPGPDPSATSWVVLGRMRSGLELRSVAAALHLLSRRTHGFGMGGTGGPTVQRLGTFLARDRASLVWSVWAVALALLLLTCCAIISLELTRGLRRQREFAVRLALGATPYRLVLQVLLKSFSFAASACAVGVALGGLGGWWGREALRAEFGAAGRAPGPGWPAAVGLVLALMFVVTLLCAAVPAWQAASRDPRQSLLSGLDHPRSFWGHWGAQEILVVAQVCLAVVLLAAAGLQMQHAIAYTDPPLGFNPQRLATVQTQVPAVPAQAAANRALAQARRWTPAVAMQMRVAALAELSRDTEISEAARLALASLPGVAAVGVLQPAPFGPSAPFRLQVSSSDPTPFQTGPPHFSRAATQYVSDNAFQILGLRLLAGRTFAPSDAATMRRSSLALAETGRAAGLPTVPVVVNSAFARENCPGRSAVGQSFYAPFPMRVVGVVSDAMDRLQPPGAEPTVYQLAPPGTLDFLVRLRAGAAFSAFAPEAGRAIEHVGPSIAPADVQDLSRDIARARRPQILLLWLLGGMALVGLAAAVLGVYAGADGLTASRRSEFAVRAALGAAPRDLYAIAARRAGRLILAAMPASALGSWLLTRGLAHWAHGPSQSPWATFAAAAVLFALLVFAVYLHLAARALHPDLGADLRASS